MVRANVKTIWFVFKTLHADFRRGIKRVKHGLVTTQRHIDNTKNSMIRLGATMKIQQTGFQMWALGVMFFGMQIMRVFSRIAKVAFDTFEKVMGESINTAREAIMGLSASWEMLKFSIGNAIATALEPLMPIILNIIDKISDWIERHPKLTAILVIFGIVLGGIMFFFGQMVLFVSSLAIFWVMWGSAIQSVIGVLAGVIVKFLLLNPLFWLIIAALIVLIAAWKKNWFGFRDIVKTVVKVIWDVIKTWLDDIVAIFKLVWELVVAIFTGEWGKIPGILKKIGAKIIELVFDIFFGIIEIVLAVLLGIYTLIYNMWTAVFSLLARVGKKIYDWFAKWWGKGGIWGLMKGIAQGIVNTVLWMFSQIVGIVQLAIKSFNKLFGTDYNIEVLQKIRDYRVDFGGTPKESIQTAPTVSIIIQGNVIGEEVALKKLGDQIQENMRRQGNLATRY